MASTAQSVNVLRWSALAVGLIYGIIHNNTLHRQADHAQALQTYNNKEKLIQQAKDEYRRQNTQKSGGEQSLDLNDPKSLETWFESLGS